MGRRLKKIIRQDLGESAKKVVDSLIANTSKNDRKEVKKEYMRCKIEIFDGTVKRNLTDSFIVNTEYIEDTIKDIVDKYDSNVQFTITNLFDEKIVARRIVYAGGYDKNKYDRFHFNKQMEIFRKIHKMKDEGKSEIETCSKFSNLATKEHLKLIYNKSEDEFKQMLRDEYGNQTLGVGQEEILSEDLNTKKNNMDISNLEGENNDE